MTERWLRTLVVDDEPVANERMRILCAAVAGVEVVGSASGGTDAIKAIEKLAPDLVLLDIAMPGLDGFAVARAVEALAEPPAIVFCTAYDQHALAAFEVAALDYLLKPISAERLSRAIERVRGMARRTAAAPVTRRPWIEEIWLPHRGAMIRLAATDIDRIEAERDYMRLWTGSASYLLHETITRLERRLDPDTFIRLRRSVIVRRTLVVGLRHDGLGIWSALLRNEGEVRIGPTFLAGVKSMLKS